MPRVPYAFLPLRLPVLGYAVASFLGPWLLPWFMRLVYCHRTDDSEAGGRLRPLPGPCRRLALRQVCRHLEIRPLTEIAALLQGLASPGPYWGERDRILDPAQGHWIAAHLPQAEFHLLPEVGHAPQEEAPEPVNKIIIDFLGRSLKNE
jgi:pimeloyl-ACP methyl ester carboxylesterase